MVSLTDAINKVPFIPGKLGQLGLFTESGVTTTTVMIEERQGILNLIETTSRGAPAVQNHTNKRKMLRHSFQLTSKACSRHCQSCSTEARAAMTPANTNKPKRVRLSCCSKTLLPTANMTAKLGAPLRHKPSKPTTSAVQLYLG